VQERAVPEVIVTIICKTCLSSIASIISCTSLAASVAPRYSYINIGSLANRGATATDINIHGEVVGMSLPDATSSYNHAFHYANGVMTDLGTLGGRASEASTIRDDGVIFGSSHTSPTQTVGGNPFIYQAGVMTNVGFSTLGVYDLNSSDAFVGWEFTSPGYTGYVYDGGVKTYIPTLGGRDSYALGLNDEGVAVGFSHSSSGDLHAIRFVNDQTEDLGTLGGTYSEAAAINSHGHIAGSSTVSPDSEELHLFVYRDGIMTDLGTTDGDVYVEDITDSGLIVGKIDRFLSGVNGGFLYADGQIWDLNSIVADLPAGWQLGTARAINELGQFVVGSLLCTPQLRWKSSGTGTWDTSANWTLDLRPSGVHDVHLDPAMDLTILGPTSNTTIKALRIGGGSGIVTLSLSSGHIIATGGITITPTGVLDRSGVIAGDVVNLGTVRTKVGDLLEVNGSLTNTGTLASELGGITEYGQFEVTGNASLDGELYITFSDGFRPAPGDEFDVLTYGSRDGEFSTIVNANLGEGQFLQPSYGADRLTLISMQAGVGDTDLDGDVDLSDLGTLATSYGQNNPNIDWVNGDFDHDNDVDLSDLGTLATNYSAGEAQAYADFAAMVPEPSGLAVLAMVGVMMRRRQR
jgi:probable HAF family extracellular repeat protein